MLSVMRHALSFLPNSPFDTNHGRLLCIRNYWVATSCWSFTSGCDTCADAFRERLHPYTGCQAPEACACNICRCQPPTLRDMALNIVFTMSLSMARFAVTFDTAYGQGWPDLQGLSLLTFLTSPSASPTPPFTLIVTILDAVLTCHGRPLHFARSVLKRCDQGPVRV
jgi:hypothetical protein